MIHTENNDKTKRHFYYLQRLDGDVENNPSILLEKYICPLFGCYSDSNTDTHGKIDLGERAINTIAKDAAGAASYFDRNTISEIENSLSPVGRAAFPTRKSIRGALSALGYEQKRTTIDGKNGRLWSKDTVLWAQVGEKFEPLQWIRHDPVEDLDELAKFGRVVLEVELFNEASSSCQ